MSDLRVEPLSADNFEAFTTLHDGPGCAGCYCMYWHYPQDNRAWQMEPPASNRAAKLALLADGAAHGLLAMRVAFVGALDRPIAKAAPWAELRARAVASLDDHAIKLAAALDDGEGLEDELRCAALDAWLSQLDS